jgi:NAD-dependent DNA ligase
MKHPIARYLMSAYAYYVEDKPLISDMEFDKLAKYIRHNYDELEHIHKHLVTIGDLDAGTYLGQYPNRVKNAVSHYRGTIRGKAPYVDWEI